MTTPAVEQALHGCTAHRSGRMARHDPAYEMTKRVFDVLGASVLGVVTLPLIVFLLIVAPITSKGAPIHRQRRRGRGGREIVVYKFRTMTCVADGQGHHLAARWPAEVGAARRSPGPRITRLGRWLRQFSVDELPQLWNVLRGATSLVGRRPILAVDHERFVHEQSRRRSWQEARETCTPGLTGLWQVSGRNDLPSSELVRLDLENAECRSSWLDLTIILRTIPAVLSRRGAY
ncbi:MAG: sugar transferase [Planctomycetota bacterium]